MENKHKDCYGLGYARLLEIVEKEAAQSENAET